MRINRAKSATQIFQNGSETPFTAAQVSILGMIAITKTHHMTCSSRNRRKTKEMTNERRHKHYWLETWRPRFLIRSSSSGKRSEKHLWISIERKLEKFLKRNLETFWIFGVSQFQMRFFSKFSSNLILMEMAKYLTRISSCLSVWRCSRKKVSISESINLNSVKSIAVIKMNAGNPQKITRISAKSIKKCIKTTLLKFSQKCSKALEKSGGIS